MRHGIYIGKLEPLIGIGALLMEVKEHGSPQVQGLARDRMLLWGRPVILAQFDCVPGSGEGPTPETEYTVIGNVNLSVGWHPLPRGDFWEDR